MATSAAVSTLNITDSIDQGYDDTQGDVADAATHVQCGLSRKGLRVNYKAISFGRPIRQHWCEQSRERALQAASSVKELEGRQSNGSLLLLCK
jgi:hypothetical protein